MNCAPSEMTSETGRAGADMEDDMTSDDGGMNHSVGLLAEAVAAFRARAHETSAAAEEVVREARECLSLRSWHGANIIPIGSGPTLPGTSSGVQIKEG